MDTYSAVATARMLQTSVPRVVRAIERLGIKARTPGGRVALTQKQFERLRNELGVTPSIDGLSPTEVKVLSALARAPLGLASARVAAARSCVSPTAASRALRSLEAKGLVLRESCIVAAGRARSMELLRANYASSRWPGLAPQLAKVVQPHRHRSHDRRVPHYLRHLFWNTAPEQMVVKDAGAYIARRLLNTGDLEGLAWGAANLNAYDWERGARARGLDASTRALARNLADGSVS